MVENKEKEEIKEDFCPVCVASVPLAFSVTTAGATQVFQEKEVITDEDDEDEVDRKRQMMRKNRHRAKWVLIWCLIIGLISLGFLLYFKFLA